MSSSSKASSSNSIVTLVSNDSNDDVLKHAKIVTLKHPSTNQDQHFLQTSNNALLEIQSLSRPKNYGSFLIGSRLISNGAIHTMTPVDPLFLAVAYLQQQTTNAPRWEPMDQFLHDNIPEIIVSALSSNSQQWKHLCDVNDQLGDDCVLIKFSETKTLRWLALKHESVQKACESQLLWLKRNDANMTTTTGGGAFHGNFVLDDDKTSDEEKKDDSEMTLLVALSPSELNLAKQESLQVICEYLSPQWREKLLTHLNLAHNDYLLSDQEKARRVSLEESNDDDESTNKRKRTASAWDSNPGQDDADDLLLFTMGADSNKKTTAETTKTHNKMHAQSAGVKRLAKVSTKGMNKLSSFFQKKG